MWHADGAEFISENLPAWLEATTERGSGDDIALALLGIENEKIGGSI
jgi:hypothetical protein